MPSHRPLAATAFAILLLLCLAPAARSQPVPSGEKAAPAPAAPPTDRAIRIEDALGQPLVGADVVLTLHPRTAPNPGAAPAVSRLKTNEGGLVALPAAEGVAGTVEVSHADWGTARAELTGPGGFFGSLLVVPLVKHDTPAYTRALRGLVLGPDHQPVAGAAVRCSHVRTPGEGLISSGATAAALSDGDGHFSLYVPDASRPGGGLRIDDGDPVGGNRLPERGALVPANSHFHVTVEVPGDDGFFPYSGDLLNVDEAVIRLQRPPGAHTFAYESPQGGSITDPATLQNVRLWYTPPKAKHGQEDAERFPLPGRYVTGGKLAAGNYLPELDRLQFLPVEVKDDSPAGLVFHLAPPVTYRGRVVDGVTGSPLAGAFVLAMNGTGEDNLALLDRDGWRALHDLPAGPQSDAPALDPLRKMYTFDGIVRTDEHGNYELTRKRGTEPAYGLVIFEQDYLPILHRLYATKPGPYHLAGVKDVPLFPAARVLVRPVVKDGAAGQSVAVSPRWAPAPAGQPDWFGSFRAAADNSERQFQYDRWLKHNQKQPVFVPAGLTLRVEFDTPYNDEWSPAGAAGAAGPVRLEAGATRDLGDLTFEPSLAVTVRVVNEAGRGVEGAPVRRLDSERNIWSVAHNSDAEGKVQFYVRPNSAGQFGVIDLPGLAGPNQPANLVCPYRLGGKEDAESPFTIRMTRQQAEVLSGPKPGEL